MSGSLIETLMDSEQRTNRSCAITALWVAAAMTVICLIAMTVPHAYFGVPCYPLCEESREGLQLFLDGRFGPTRYWRYLAVDCYPSFALCLSFFAITMDRLCKSHLEALERQAKVNARLADVEKGLVLAAAQMMSSLCPPSDVLCPDEGAHGTRHQAPINRRLIPGPRRRSSSAFRGAGRAPRGIRNSPRSSSAIRRRP